MADVDYLVITNIYGSIRIFSLRYFVEKKKLFTPLTGADMVV